MFKLFNLMLHSAVRRRPCKLSLWVRPVRRPGQCHRTVPLVAWHPPVARRRVHVPILGMPACPQPSSQLVHSPTQFSRMLSACIVFLEPPTLWSSSLALPVLGCLPWMAGHGARREANCAGWDTQGVHTTLSAQSDCAARILKVDAIS